MLCYNSEQLIYLYSDLCSREKEAIKWVLYGINSENSQLNSWSQANVSIYKLKYINPSL